MSKAKIAKSEQVVSQNLGAEPGLDSGTSAKILARFHTSKIATYALMEEPYDYDAEALQGGALHATSTGTLTPPH